MYLHNLKSRRNYSEWYYFHLRIVSKLVVVYFDFVSFLTSQIVCEIFAVTSWFFTIIFSSGFVEYQFYVQSISIKIISKEFFCNFFMHANSTWIKSHSFYIRVQYFNIDIWKHQWLHFSNNVHILNQNIMTHKY